MPVHILGEIATEVAKDLVESHRCGLVPTILDLLLLTSHNVYVILVTININAKVKNCSEGFFFLPKTE